VVESDRTPKADAVKAGAIMGGLLATWVGVVAVRNGLRVIMRWVQLSVGFGRFWYLAGTLQLLRRCPDCRRAIVRDARVCRHCGWRRG
jgi:hypothetical protein